jgi:DNA-binding PadR family transcriptional regulator
MGPAEGQYSDPQFLVLASLAGSPKHGHAMLDDIERMCGARPGPGTLYGAIARLEQQGLIEPLPAEDRRRPYRLTEAGERAFTAKLKTLQRIVRYGARRLAPA